jgi:hypothetical protein
VITSDLDVVGTHLRPFLETYLPFVLAVPFATLAMFLAAALRAVNRTLGSVIVSHYCMNFAILVAATAVSGMLADNALLVLSWTFFAGAALAAAVGVVITRRVFEAPPDSKQVDIGADAWRRIYASAASNGLTGIALAVLIWGPLCVLALWAPAAQVAQYALVSRTAQIVDFLIPSVIIVPQSICSHSRFARAMRTERGKLAVDYLVSLVHQHVRRSIHPLGCFVRFVAGDAMDQRHLPAGDSGAGRQLGPAADSPDAAVQRDRNHGHRFRGHSAVRAVGCRRRGVCRIRPSIWDGDGVRLQGRGRKDGVESERGLLVSRPYWGHLMATDFLVFCAASCIGRERIAAQISRAPLQFRL